MRIFIATIGSAPHARAQRNAFADLAAADVVGAHHWDEDPARADAILFVDLQQHVDDPFLHRLRAHRLARAFADKAYVYDARDQPIYTYPGIYVSGTPAWARRRSMVGGPYPLLMSSLRPTGATPDLLYSFQGSRTHPVRDAVLGLSHPRGYVEDTTALDLFSPAESARAGQQAARLRYAETVSRSKFVLCPRGHGPSTFRLFETMHAGRVPVVISDTWLPPPRVDWDRCVLRVPEAAVGDLPDHLERLEDGWDDLVTAGREVVAEHFAVSRLWHHYAASIADLQPHLRDRRGPWWAQSSVLRVAARRARASARGRRARFTSKAVARRRETEGPPYRQRAGSHG